MKENSFTIREALREMHNEYKKTLLLGDAVSAEVPGQCVDVDVIILDIHSGVPKTVGCNVTTHRFGRVVAGLNDPVNAVGVLTLNVFRRLDATDGDAGSIAEVDDNGTRPKGVEHLGLVSASVS